MPDRAPKTAEIHGSCLGASSPPGPAPCLRKTVPICLIFGDKLHFLSSFPIFPAAGLAQISREARENFLILTSLILRKTALLLLKALGFRGLRECAHLSTRACRGPGNPQGARGRPDPCQGPHDGTQARAASPRPRGTHPRSGRASTPTVPCRDLLPPPPAREVHRQLCPSHALRVMSLG